MKTNMLVPAILMLILTTLLPAVAAAEGGLTFTEIRSEKSPLISFRIVLRTGAINDPSGKEGLNALTANLIAQGGTRDLTYQQVVEKLYPWAAGIGVQVDQEITTFVAEVHRDHLDQFYTLLSSLLLTPRFDPADFKRVKDLSLNYLQNSLRSTDDENLGKQALNGFLFQNHPYRNTEIGTVQGITSITIEDVKAWYRDTYVQSAMWVGLAGGYPASLVERIRNDFSALPVGNVKPIQLPAPAPIKNLEVIVVEKPARGYAVSMGFPINVTRKEQDFYPLLVMNSYFGEHRTFNGVLMNRLRGDRGLNYGDYSYIEKFVGGTGSGSRFPELNTPLRQQAFTIWLRPMQPENTHFGIRNALFELNNLVEKGMSAADFEKTRKFVVNYSKLWAQTLNRRLGYQMDSEFYGTEYFIDRIERELAGLTVDKVNAAIRKYMTATNLKLAVVVDEGKGKAFLEALSASAPSPITYASPVSETIKQQDKIIEVFPLTVNPAASKVVHAKDLFER